MKKNSKEKITEGKNLISLYSKPQIKRVIFTDISEKGSVFGEPGPNGTQPGSNPQAI